MTTQNEPLADRIRAELVDERSVREVTMFGGLSFMINEKMLVAVGGDGDLLVRADPARNAELLQLPGAKQAQMGAGRSMGPSWILVAHDSVAAGDDLSFWLDVAREYNARAHKSTS